MSGFMPIPAVDIRGGRCVRLVEGDFARETRYADDPAEMARHWAAEGAQRLHVVDLDGARDGVRANADVIERVLHAVNVPVQVGGGVRTIDTARALLDAGADRIVVGTAAAEHPEVLATWLAVLGPERLIVSVDSRDGYIATRGWQTPTEHQTFDYCRALQKGGVRRVLYTDVGRDGMLSGPDVDGTRRVAQILPVIGSGGVASIADLRALADAGAEGAIVGTALYQQKITLRDALAVAAPC